MIDRLPSDIIQYILYSFMVAEDINNMSLTNRSFFDVINSHNVWAQLCYRDNKWEYIPHVFRHLLSREKSNSNHDKTTNNNDDNDVLIDGHNSNDAAKEKEEEDDDADSIETIKHFKSQFPFSSSFPMTKKIYCILYTQSWRFEKPTPSDVEVSTDHLTCWRKSTTTRNPTCLCTGPFLIEEQTSKQRHFRWRSYFEVRVEDASHWLCIGASSFEIRRYDDSVLGNSETKGSIGYYGAQINPTINLNNEILSDCGMRPFTNGDIVGIHVYSVKDADCLVDDAVIAQYRSAYMTLRQRTHWKVFAAIYLNGKMICELPVVEKTDMCFLYPAVCLAHRARVKILFSKMPKEEQVHEASSQNASNDAND